VTKTEFASVIAYLETACGKPICADPALALVRTRVYFDLLGDLPLHVLEVAAKMAVLEPLYGAFPTVHLLRRMAQEAIAGKEGCLTAFEAFSLACGAARRFGQDQEKGLASLPASVALAARAIGWQAICDSNPKDCDTIRAHFRDVFQQTTAREQKAKALPPALAKAVAAIGHELEGPKALSAPKAAEEGDEE
jgi:hypothetical protein